MKIFVVLLGTLCCWLGVVTGAQANPSANDPSCLLGTTMTITAHQDDTLLFMSPDILNDIQVGRCVRSVFVTAGDDGGSPSYWAGREAGVEAAYAEMAAIPDSWSTQTVIESGHPMTMATLDGDPRLTLFFMRLPNQMLDPNAPDVWYPTQLSALKRGWIPTLTTVDGSTSYSRQGVVKVLGALMKQYQPTRIDTQDFVDHYGWGDHADHRATAFFTLIAFQTEYHRGVLVSYLGYNTVLRAPNVTGDDLDGKVAAYDAYAPNDPLVPQTSDALQQSIYGKWLSAQYILAMRIDDDTLEHKLGRRLHKSHHKNKWPS